MSKHIIFALAIILLLVASVALGSKKPAPPGAGLIIEVNKAIGEPISIFCVPDGSGYAISSSFAYKGGLVDPLMTVKVMDEFSRPLAGIPADKILLGPAGNKNSFCGNAGAVVSSGSTDQDGIIPLNGVVRGSGYVAPTGDGLFVMVTDGTDVGESGPIGVYMNSADINNDGVVDSGDMDLFNRDMGFKYNYRCDFNWDGAIDVIDQTMLSAAMGKSCN